jgi:hypothetical protein
MELDEEKRLLVIALPSWDPQRRRSFLCGYELQINPVVLSLACLSSSSSLTLEAIFGSISIFVLLLVKSLVAGGFYIVYAKFDSFTFCKFKFFITYCTLPSLVS